jgi:hypothetical protein
MPTILIVGKYRFFLIAEKKFVCMFMLIQAMVQPNSGLSH